MTASPLRAVPRGLLVVGLLLPFVPLLVWAGSGQWRYPALVPQHRSARGLRLLVDPASEVVQGLVTSLTLGVLVSALACLLGLSAGRALGLYAFRGKRLVQFLLLAPAIVPGLAVTLGIQVYFLRYGLAGTLQGVVLVQLVPTVPYVTLVLGSAFANFETGYEDAARSLGAGPLRTFWHVTLPVLRPSLVVAAFFAFLLSWSEYVLTLLIGGGTVKTLPLLLFAYIGGSDLTEAAALALLFVTPPFLLVLLTSRVLTGSSSA
ncbi:MAG: transporter permease subunit, partial [Frankiales bacterium]|nr:transporter permease subunit [Frankiales bacterium]